MVSKAKASIVSDDTCRPARGPCGKPDMMTDVTTRALAIFNARQRPNGPQAGSRTSASEVTSRALIFPSSVDVISTSRPCSREA